MHADLGLLGPSLKYIDLSIIFSPFTFTFDTQGWDIDGVTCKAGPALYESPSQSHTTSAYNGWRQYALQYTCDQGMSELLDKCLI